MSGLFGRNIKWLLSVGTAWAFCHSAFAQPDIGTRELLHGITVFHDHTVSNLFYYAPRGLTLARETQDCPQLRFRQMRYTGSHATGDQGVVRHTSILQFKVVLTDPTQDSLAFVRQNLATRSGEIVLVPIPIQSMITSLAYVSLDTVSDEQSNSTVLNGYGHFEQEDPSTGSSNGSVWRENSYTLRLDNYTSQLMWEAFTRGAVPLSVGFVAISAVFDGQPLSFELTGEGEMVSDLREKLSEIVERYQNTTLVFRPVVASALSVTCDTTLCPDLMTRREIDAQVPPDYPILEVRCYDFYDKLRTDLFAKIVTFKTLTVAGDTVWLEHTFGAEDANVYAKNVSFDVAIDMRKPLFYQVTEISFEEAPTVTDWIEAESWHKLIDITTDNIGDGNE